MRVRVCDDLEPVAEQWVAAIREVVPEGFDVERMVDAKTEVSRLLDRKIAFEAGDRPPAPETVFDDIDILVVDYDLVHLDGNGSRTTGEGVARLARTYSKCGAILLLNQYKGSQFDLGMRGHLHSFADLNIEANLVGKAALWQKVRPEAENFNPTFWTLLPALRTAAQALAMKLESENLDFPIMPLLGLTVEALAELSDTSFGFISQVAETPDDLNVTTLGQFLRQSLDIHAAANLIEKAPPSIFAFAAFRLVKWLDRTVLRPMNVLIDAAHLLERLPFLIDSDKVNATDAACWTDAAAAPRSLMRWNLIDTYHNALASSVLGKDVFDWFRLVKDEAIEAMQEEYLKKEAPRYFLAEDTSRFVGKAQLTRFRADFHNFGDRRAIEKLPNISYGPLRRIRFG